MPKPSVAHRVSLRDMFLRAEVVCPPIVQLLPNVMVHTNASEMGLTDFMKRALRATYAPREVAYDDVRIGCLLEGALVYGGLQWVRVQNAFAAEQVLPFLDFDDVARSLDDWRAIPQDVEGPCLLLARYGEDVWGHWLCELLPAAVIAEVSFPGKFRFAVSGSVTKRTEERSFSNSVLESLSAYGIGEERLIRLDAGVCYRFQELHAVSGLWTLASIHPDVLRIMRAKVRCEVGAHKNIALLRRQGDATRTIYNMPEIADLLGHESFHQFDAASLPFSVQAGLFAGASRVFSVLGSGLAGLIYSPDDVQVVGAAPGEWADAYFRSILQHRNAAYADVRGPSLWTGEGLERDAPFLVNPDHLRRALHAVQLPPGQMFSIDNLTIPRHLEPAFFEIDFSASGNSAAFRGEGWSHQESHHVWSDGPLSTLIIPANLLPSSSIIIDLSVFALVAPPYLVARRLEIEVGDTKLGDYALEGYDRILCLIPAECVKEEQLKLEFRHTPCVSSRCLGYSQDDRAISSGFMSLKLRHSAF